MKKISEKLWANASLVMACLQNYQLLLIFVYQNSKRVPYSPWQNAYSKLKSSSHILSKNVL